MIVYSLINKGLTLEFKYEIRPDRWFISGLLLRLPLFINHNP